MDACVAEACASVTGADSCVNVTDACASVTGADSCVNVADLCINTNITTISHITLQKMKFLYNALENGWTVVKKEDKYIFNKKHEGEKENYLDSYLQQFLMRNMSDISE